MRGDHSATAAELIGGLDLSGRVAVITGASGGIGLETARALVAAGVTVVLGNRSGARAACAAADLRASAAGAAIELGALDLASLTSVREFAAFVDDHHDRIDILVNNAGVMATPFARTVDGFELQFGTNHLGHFLLTNLLMPSLVAGAPSRIVNVTSSGHRVAGIRWDDPNFLTSEYEPWQAYGQSKTANILFTLELERRFGDRGVHAYAVHPGLVATELGRNLGDADRVRFAGRMASGEAKSSAQGAVTSVFAATSAELDGHGGAYLEDCHRSDAIASHATDPADAARLWTVSEQLVGQTFPLAPPRES